MRSAEERKHRTGCSSCVARAAVYLLSRLPRGNWALFPRLLHKTICAIWRGPRGQLSSYFHRAIRQVPGTENRCIASQRRHRPTILAINTWSVRRPTPTILAEISWPPTFPCLGTRGTLTGTFSAQIWGLSQLSRRGRRRPKRASPPRKWDGPLRPGLNPALRGLSLAARAP